MTSRRASRERIRIQSRRLLRPGRRVSAAVAVAACLAAAPAARADEALGRIAADAGLGGASALVTALYAPAKLVLAAGGLVTGGALWLASGGRAGWAERIVAASARGDYVVTREQLRGLAPLHFLGDLPDDAAPLAVSSGGEWSRPDHPVEPGGALRPDRDPARHAS
jgi:hypothetical protein